MFGVGNSSTILMVFGMGEHDKAKKNSTYCCYGILWFDIATGMSSVELSEAVGISESHLRKIEAGTRQPGIRTCSSEEEKKEKKKA